MRSACLAWMLAASLAAPVKATAVPLASASIFRALCKVDAEISTADRSQPEAVALKLVQDLAGGRPTAVFEALSDEARLSTPEDRLAALAKMAGSAAPFSEIRVAHTYMINVSGGRNPLRPMACGKTLRDPDGVILSIRALPLQFHVEVTAHTKNNDWSGFVWLAPQPEGLKVLAFNLAPSALSGRSALDLRELARRQTSRGHAFNAGLLYMAAEAMAGRGPNAAPAWKPDLDHEAATFAWPKEMTGPPPRLWSLDGQTYSIQNAYAIGLGGELDLMIERRPAEWPSDAAVDADSRRLILALVKAHPEMAESFPGIVVRAFNPDGQHGFATVFTFAKGLH